MPSKIRAGSVLERELEQERLRFEASLPPMLTPAQMRAKALAEIRGQRPIASTANNALQGIDRVMTLARAQVERQRTIGARARELNQLPVGSAAQLNAANALRPLLVAAIQSDASVAEELREVSTALRGTGAAGASILPELAGVQAQLVALAEGTAQDLVAVNVILGRPAEDLSA